MVLARLALLVVVVAIAGCGVAAESIAQCEPSAIKGVWPAGTTVTLTVDGDLLEPARVAAAAWKSPASRVGIGLDVVPGACDHRALDGVSCVARASTAADYVAGSTFRDYHFADGAHHIVEADVEIGRSADDDGKLVATLVHEFGHVLGLEHSADPSDAMFCYVVGFSEPQPADVTALSTAYGS